MTGAEMLSLREAASRLGGAWTARSLRRYLLAYQDRTGRHVLSRVGIGSVRPTYRVSWSLLRLRCPELFAAESDLQRVVGGAMGRVLRGMHELSVKTDEVAARQAAIASVIDQRRRASK